MAGFGLPPASRATVQRCVGQGCVVALTYRYALIGSAKVMRTDFDTLSSSSGVPKLPFATRKNSESMLQKDRK